MKANAPEKIYLLHDDRYVDDLSIIWFEAPYATGSIEYVRTDVFIEKTCEWLKESVTNNPECNRIISKKGVITMGELIKDFKNYMKGE